ncbi:MAG: hypothetical protein OXG68_17970 [Chloroflexi bacterium]|nr:hypothetical protein [Chloroflexota bacterium]MCY3917779.1 hypothetical protein [Chloroflexota bacterium]
MPRTDQAAESETTANQLIRLAEMLRLDLAEEDLTALADQLQTIDALEKAELGDFPPILRMDADWHE